MYGSMKDELSAKIAALKEEGLYKAEAPLTSPQSGEITVDDGREVINLCANNYLGLADSPVLVDAAKKALDEWGFGMASVRFICGTQTLHQKPLSTSDTLVPYWATASVASLTTPMTSSHEPSISVNMDEVWLGKPDSRTTRTAAATASETPPFSREARPPLGTRLKATIMPPVLHRSPTTQPTSPGAPHRAPQSVNTINFRYAKRALLRHCHKV